ncbi:MAG: recombination mediator RecR [Anaerolineae bacterium]|nr:recombination mediator RecR [Anaerolineae bacterium]
MRSVPRSVERLIEELNRLPGIGPKTASRLTFYLLRSPRDQVQALARAIGELQETVVVCSSCFNIAETNPCSLCADTSRDHATICVVEEPLDMLAIERTGQYSGLYHVLHGAISPVEGVGPEDLKIAELISRLNAKPVDEVILATNPNLEGESTAMYISRQLTTAGVRVTRLAHGLPMGGDLEYADEVTLTRALEGRREI